MASTWWWAFDGNDANDGTTRAKAKLTLSPATGVFSLALIKNDFINAVFPPSNPLFWTLLALEADLAKAKGTNFTTDVGLTIRGTDDSGNPAGAYIKAASGDAAGNRSLFRVIAGGGYVICRNLICDATEKATDATQYNIARMTDTGTPDPGGVQFEGCPIYGGVAGTASAGLRDYLGMTGTAPPSGTDVLFIRNCYMQNCRQASASIGAGHVKTFDHLLVYIDAGASMPTLYSGTFAASIANADNRFINCTYYAKVNVAPIAGVFDLTTNNNFNIGRVDNYNNLVYIETTSASATLVYMDDGVAGVKTGCTVTGTTGNNVLLGGPSVDATNLSAGKGFYAGVHDADKDDATGLDLHTGDVVAYGVQEATVFAHPTSVYAWDMLGNGVQALIPKDLRPILYTTAGIGGATPGALPAFVPPTTDWPRSEPERGMVETWSFLTSVVTPFSGTAEQRMQLRLQPRRRIEMDFMIASEAERREEYRRIFSASANKVRVPFYQYATPITQQSNAGTQRLFFNPAQTDIRSNEYVLIYRENTREAFLVELTAMLSDGANTALPLAQDARVSDYVVPSMEGYIENPSLAMRSIVGGIRLQIMIGDIRSSFTRPGSAGVISTFDGLNVLDRRPLANDEVAEMFDRRPVIMDNDTGVYEQRQHWAHSFVEGMRQFLVQRKMQPAEMDYWRDFIYATRGMRKPFLHPTWRDDLVLNANPAPSATTFDVQTPDYSTVYFPNDTYKRLMLTAPNGEVTYRKVSSVLVLSSTVQRFTVPALPAGSQWGSGFTISYLNRVRLGSDDVRLLHFDMDTLLELAIRTTDT